MSKELLIDWLECPDCGKQDTLVKTERGNHSRLYLGDKTICMECGKDGEIETDGENAWVV